MATKLFGGCKNCDNPDCDGGCVQRQGDYIDPDTYSQADYERDIRAAQGGEPVARDAAGDAVPEHVDGSGAAYDGGGWPGDGSGTDDLADLMQREADDYRNE